MIPSYGPQLQRERVNLGVSVIEVPRQEELGPALGISSFLMNMLCLQSFLFGFFFLPQLFNPIV